MKIKFLFFTITISTLLLWSCQDSWLKSSKPAAQPQLTNEEMARLVLLDTSYLYPESRIRDQVADIAAKFLDKNDGYNRTISSLTTIPSLYSLTGKTSIKTDFTISKPKTPALYVANFKDHHGYVILSADKRAPEVLAMVGNGTIDSLIHMGMRIFFENSVKHVDEKVAHAESLRGDEIFKSMVAKLEADLAAKQNAKPNDAGRVANVPCQQASIYVPGQTTTCGGGCTSYVSSFPISTMNITNYVASPLLKTQWDQGPPYNLGQPIGGTLSNPCTSRGYCGTSANYLAGCVAVAEGQVVAYFYGKKNIGDWASVTSTATGCAFTPNQVGEVASLLHNIYLDYGIYVSRTCGYTGAGGNIGDIHLTNPRGISPSRGLVQGEWRSWNTGDIRNSLRNGSPVVISGTLHLCCFITCWGCGDGHEWLIDGMRDLGVQTTLEVYTSYSGTGCPSDSYYTYNSTSVNATQIHQNWGWGPGSGGDANDWYAQDVFQSNIAPYVSGDINFDHANYIVAYITPL